MGILRKGNLKNFEERREGLRESMPPEERGRLRSEVREEQANYKKKHM